MGPEARQYLVCVAERDLNTLLPLLPQLATNQDFVPAAAWTNSAPTEA